MILNTIIKALKPFRLISLVMTYLLGAGLVQYVREMRSWSVFIQGAFFLLFLALSLDFLVLLHEISDLRNWPVGTEIRQIRQVRLLVAMIIGTFLTVATTIIISWMLRGAIERGLLLLLVSVLIIGGLYYFSRVVNRFKGLQLLFEAIIFVVLPPAVAYFLQSAVFHQFLTLAVIGLVPAYLANRLLGYLERFGSDVKNNVSTLVTQMGWENAMFYHNAMILLTYLIFAMVAWWGIPWFLIWPVFLTLPIGLLQVWLMERVRRGMKPLWRVMRFATACIFFIPIYLIGFAFWIR